VKFSINASSTSPRRRRNGVGRAPVSGIQIVSTGRRPRPSPGDAGQHLVWHAAQLRS
jgi:hypothetical protein